ncbi:UNVERIFIED_ORG: hypothetical protein J2Y81_008044 [Paraburkholderia sediminicola]|nr:hypothetical protein [Paraburkholderia sediminicola]
MNAKTVLHSNAGTSFNQFMASLRDPDSIAPIVSARRFGEALHIDLRTLAQRAHGITIRWPPACLRERQAIFARSTSRYPGGHRYIR